MAEAPEKIGFLEVSPNNKSMGRLLSLLGAILGSVVVMVGTVGFMYTVIVNPDHAGSCIPLILGGLAETGVSQGAKVWQKKMEAS